MKVLFDTSVLVAGIIESHPSHDRALPWLKRAKTKEFGYLVAAHSVAELYAILSTLPTSPRITTGLARRLVRENVESVSRVVALSSRDYAATIDELAELGLPGGAVYDGLIARAAQKVRADRLLTLNVKDFLRVWPKGAERVTPP